MTSDEIDLLYDLSIIIHEINGLVSVITLVIEKKFKNGSLNS